MLKGLSLETDWAFEKYTFLRYKIILASKKFKKYVGLKLNIYVTKS